jgi:selenoprotein W-related protein
MIALAAVARHVKIASSFVVPRVVAPSSSIISRKHVQLSAAESSQHEIHLSIEYCSGCQWMLRSTWMAAEILTTFANDESLASVSMLPMSPPLSEGGIFRITAKNSIEENANITMLWDRSVQGRFPESKEVKQLIRDLFDPDKDLGHSDKQNDDTDDDSSSGKENDCVECTEQQQQEEDKKQTSQQPTNGKTIPDIFYEKNKISIEYSSAPVSSSDNGLYRATFLCNELLSCAYERNAWYKRYQKQEDDCTIEDAPTILDCVTLVPNRDLNDALKIQLNDEVVIYDHSKESSADDYIDASELRKLVTKTIKGDDDEKSIEMMSDDEAEEARKYFGVF